MSVSESDPLLQQDIQELEHQPISMSECIFNLTNTAIGAGTVAIPFVFKNLGWIQGFIFLLVAAVTTAWSLHLLGRVSASIKKHLITDLAKETLGPKGEVGVVIFMLLLLFAPLIAYQIIICDYFLILVKAFDAKIINEWYFDSRLVTAVLDLIVLLPLCASNCMSKLAKLSIVCLICIFYMICVVVIDSVKDGISMDNLVSFKLDFKALGGFATLLMAFISHTTVLDAFKELDRPTTSRRGIIILATNTTVFICYALVGFFGYAHFKESTSDNILTQTTSIEFVIGSVTFGLMISLTYPFIVIPASHCLTWILERIGHKPQINVKNRHFVFALVFITTSYLLNLLWRDIATVFALFGCACGSMIVFIFPSLFFLYCDKLENIVYWEKLVAWINIFIGALLFLVGTTVQLIGNKF